MWVAVDTIENAVYWADPNPTEVDPPYSPPNMTHHVPPAVVPIGNSNYAV